MENTFNSICRPCLGVDSFAVKSSEGVSCFKVGHMLMHLVDDASSQLKQNYNNFIDPKLQCFYSDRYKVPNLGSNGKVNNLGRELYMKFMNDFSFTTLPKEGILIKFAISTSEIFTIQDILFPNCI